jgi:transposase
VGNEPPSRQPTYDELLAENAALRRQIGHLEEQVARLQKRIEELVRSGKRQAAPFSKGEPKRDPSPPGRKPGKAYGRRAFLAPPAQVDEENDVPLPEVCPFCRGRHLEELWTDVQFQVDLPPVRPIWRRFWIHIGWCESCEKRIQPRHALQTSDALGAAAVQLGPNVLALGTLFNKGYGLSWGKVASIIGRAFGLKASRSTYCRAAERVGDQLEPTYGAMVEAVKTSPVVNPDETGWKVGGQRWWLWDFVTAHFTLYRIARSRGGDVLEEILGLEFSGIVGRDGWAPYGRLENAEHQSCLAHHLTRVRELLEVAQRGAARFPLAVKRILLAALSLRDRVGEISVHGFAVARGQIEARMDRLLKGQPTDLANARFARHLRNERPYLFTFLYHPEVEATNWPAEQAIRPAVITRKMSGGNRTARGAHAQEVLTSVIRTCYQQGRDALGLLAGVLCNKGPVDVGLTRGP